MRAETAGGRRGCREGTGGGPRREPVGTEELGQLCPVTTPAENIYRSQFWRLGGPDPGAGECPVTVPFLHADGCPLTVLTWWRETSLSSRGGEKDHLPRLFFKGANLTHEDSTLEPRLLMPSPWGLGY